MSSSLVKAVAHLEANERESASVPKKQHNSPVKEMACRHAEDPCMAATVQHLSSHSLWVPCLAAFSLLCLPSLLTEFLFCEQSGTNSSEEERHIEVACAYVLHVCVIPVPVQRKDFTDKMKVKS